ncbi:MAG TPA: hypothetical protein VL494_27225 [Steroidobacteraceae bacterium]|nr:hypothetical protein [Steroidobacteraceae bacterium]
MSSGSLSGDCIEPDTSIRNTRLAGGRDFESLDADLHEQRLRIPWRRRHFRGYAERHVAARRRHIAVVEVVDHLFHAHGVLRRQLAGVEEATHVGVRAGVDVDRERRDRLVGDEMDRVVVEVLVTLGVLDLLIRRRYSGKVAGHFGRSCRDRDRRSGHHFLGHNGDRRCLHR